MSIFDAPPAPSDEAAPVVTDQGAGEEELVEYEEPASEQEQLEEGGDEGEEAAEELEPDPAPPTKSIAETYRELTQTDATQQPLQQGTNEEQRAAVLQAFEEDPIGTLQYFAQMAINPIQAERSQERLIANIEKVAESHPEIRADGGMKQLMDRCADIAAELGNPNLGKNPTPRMLKMAAEELWSKSTAQLYQQAKAAGRQEAEASRRAKTGLAAPSSTKPKQTAPKTAVDSIRDGILAASRGNGLFGS